MLSTDLIVKPYHLCSVLDIGDRTLSAHILKGNIPRPDGRGQGGLKLWRIATIRAWRPDVADAVTALMTRPQFALQQAA